MFCEKCGKENSNQSKFCSSCGAPLKVRGQEGQIETEKKHKAVVKILLLIAGLAFILVVGIFGFKGYKEKQYKDILAQADRYLKDMDYEKAKDSYLKALEIEPNDAKSYLKLGDIYAEENNLEDANKNYEKAIEIDADSDEAYAGIIGVQMKSGEIDEIPEIVEDALKGLPEEKQSLFSDINKIYTDYKRYQSYKEIVEQYSSKECGYRYLDSRIVTGGYCFSKLVDFDGDGAEELVLSYTGSEYDMVNLSNTIDDYIVEVWTFIDGKSELLFSGEPFSFNGDGRSIVLVENEGKIYLKTGETDADLHSVYYGYEGGEFRPVVSFDAEIATLSRKINGKEATNEEWVKESNKYKNKEEYLLQGYYIYGAESNTILGLPRGQETVAEINHKLQTSYHALENLILDDCMSESLKSGIRNGSYKYAEDQKKMYLCAYTNKEGKSELLIDFCADHDLWLSTEFVYDAEKAVYVSNDEFGNNYLLSVSQTDNKLNVALKCTEMSIDILTELERETQYDDM